jgi:hypothetical protein
VAEQPAGVTKLQVLAWIRWHATEADLDLLQQRIDQRRKILTDVQPWAKGIAVPGGRVRISGQPNPQNLHGRVGEVIRATKNPMKLGVQLDDELIVRVLHVGGLEVDD